VVNLICEGPVIAPVKQTNPSAYSANSSSVTAHSPGSHALARAVSST
jgi:hypothetical protein